MTMESILHDGKFAARTLWKKPAFTTVALLTLALGIGANSAIFSVIDTLLLHNIPFEEPHRLMHLTERNSNGEEMSVAYLNFLDWRERNEVFSRMAAVRTGDVNVTGLERPSQVVAVQVDSEPRGTGRSLDVRVRVRTIGGARPLDFGFPVFLEPA